LLNDEERRGDESHVIALNKSQVPQLRTTLSQFLGSQRLRLMLDEAEVLLGQVPDEAERECKFFFSTHGLTFDSELALDNLSERNIREVCIKQLDVDKALLLEKHEEMLQAAQKWRTSPEYRQSLQSELEKICQDLDNQIDSWVKSELNSWIIETHDVVSRERHLEMYSRKYLLVAEQRLRSMVETESQRLASYYLGQFQSFLRMHRLYERLEEKGYDRNYIRERIQPVNHLHRLQKTMADEFGSVCRWVLVYELLRNPILAHDSAFGGELPDVAREVAVNIAKFAIDIELSGQTSGPTLFRGATDVIRGVMGRNQQPPQEEVSSSRTYVEPRGQRNAESKRLLERIETALRADDRRQLSELIARQLAGRNRIALSESLPYLDMLFFYELDKFQQEYRFQVEAVYTEHIAQIYDQNEDIRELLIQKNRPILKQAKELLEVLSSLRTL